MSVPQAGGFIGKNYKQRSFNNRIWSLGRSHNA